ncbi:MAG: UDP-N-acetylmuramate--L-alanine ligase [Gammaproteobacteria bacterium]|nr:UDP-N-acetylmuramate--L-alanine ligase [Gammaproteobacteria bacterium]
MNSQMGAIHHVHFVGIGGVGMGGIAEVLINLGYAVQGSDVRQNLITERLASLGAKIFIGHDSDHIGTADVVVVSSAIAPDNPEIVKATRQRIPVIQRAEMLAELMRFRSGIAVAGTHGKTTTTSLIASMLAEGGLDPTFVIGGRLASANANAQLGEGEYLVAEADESDTSFLHLQPVIAIVTNVDADHLESYEGDFGRLKQGFTDFLHNLPFYGLAVICNDDLNARTLIPAVGRRVLTYGVSDGSDIRAEDVKSVGLASSFLVHRAGHEPLELKVNLPGFHNMLNSLAAVSVATELGISDGAIKKALLEFSGIDRRFQVLGTVTTRNGLVTFVDDYAHHPTEIAATIQAARQSWPGNRIVVAFQPHRYTRTYALIDDFSEVLSGADVLLLTDIYSAGEEPIIGADGRALARAVRSRGRVEPVFVEDLKELPSVLEGVIEADDIVLMLGAGNIGALAQCLPDQLAVMAPIGVKQ